MKNVRNSVLGSHSLVLLAGTGLSLLSRAGFASPPDVVVYDDHSMVTHALQVGKDANNVDSILLLNCPPLTTVRSITECSNPIPVVSVAEFTSFVNRTVTEEAKKGTAMSPLTSGDIAVLKQRAEMLANPGLKNKAAELQSLQDQRTKPLKMVADFPGSAGFKAELEKLDQEIRKVSPNVSSLSQIDQKAKDIDARLEVYSEKILKLIQENSPDQTGGAGIPTAHVNSQNVGTLPYVVLNTLIKLGGSSIHYQGELFTVYRNQEGRLVLKSPSTENIISRPAANVTSPARLVIFNKDLFVLSVGGNKKLYAYGLKLGGWLELDGSVSEILQANVVGSDLQIIAIGTDGKTSEVRLHKDYKASNWKRL